MKVYCEIGLLFRHIKLELASCVRGAYSLPLKRRGRTAIRVSQMAQPEAEPSARPLASILFMIPSLYPALTI
jgi:hypothetical protein